jgi:hypothetical protein
MSPCCCITSCSLQLKQDKARHQGEANKASKKKASKKKKTRRLVEVKKSRQGRGDKKEGTTSKNG